MTRKHYRTLAQDIRNTLEEGGDIETLTLLAHYLCQTLKADNSAFRKETFLEACGLQDLDKVLA